MQSRNAAFGDRRNFRRKRSALVVRPPERNEPADLDKTSAKIGHAGVSIVKEGRNNFFDVCVTDMTMSH